MLTPSFLFKVGGQEYSVTPTFGLHDDIERALDSTLLGVLMNYEAGFSIKELLAICKVLPCMSDYKEDELKEFIVSNRYELNNELSSLITFLVVPNKQKEAVKKK